MSLEGIKKQNTRLRMSLRRHNMLLEELRILLGLLMFQDKLRILRGLRISLELHMRHLECY